MLQLMEISPTVFSRDLLESVWLRKYRSKATALHCLRCAVDVCKLGWHSLFECTLSAHLAGLRRGKVCFFLVGWGMLETVMVNINLFTPPPPWIFTHGLKTFNISQRSFFIPIYSIRLFPPFRRLAESIPDCLYNMSALYLSWLYRWFKYLWFNPKLMLPFIVNMLILSTVQFWRGK